MRSLDDGHLYEAEPHQGEGPAQPIQFVKKQMATDAHGNRAFATVTPGTTNEELIRIVIDRTNRLNAKAGCVENHTALGHLHLALAAFESRTRDRRARNVEGTPKD